MAKPKRKSKAKAKTPSMRGHNSASAEDDAEMLRVAKAQKALDAMKTTQATENREAQGKLTARLKAIGMSRKAFKLPYENWLAKQNAEDDDAKKQVAERNILYLAEQQRAFKALSSGDQINFLDIIDQAEKIQKSQAEAEAAALADASDSTEDAETEFV